MDELKMLSSKCGHHFDKTCTSCINAQEITDAEINRLHSIISEQADEIQNFKKILVKQL